MYPAHGLQLFPPFPRNDRVFVAISFDPRLEQRWEQVIAAGIQDAGLEPFRVNIPKTSGSIPAEIIQGISQARLVLGDVTALDGIRNGNVMYEIGIAHTCRLPGGRALAATRSWSSRRFLPASRLGRGAIGVASDHRGA
jgi:hypothetical protein